MKKIIVSILLILSFSICFPLSAMAAEPVVSEKETEYFADGSYIVYETVVFDNWTRASTKSAKQTGTGYDSNGSKVFTMTLNATFSYGGGMAEAKKASCTYSINKSGWKKDSITTDCSGDTAYADGYFSSSSDSADIHLSLTCDTSGNIS